MQNNYIYNIKRLSLIFSFFISWIFFLLYVFYGNLYSGFMLYKLNKHFIWNNFLNINFLNGIDSVSIIFILLVVFLINLSLLSTWNNIKYKLKEFVLLLFLVESILILFFLTNDLFFFYIFFESVLIPMFLIIGIWGSRARKIHAVYVFFFYTFVGSMLMLFGILIIYSSAQNLDIMVLLNVYYDEDRQKLLWILFFIALCIKIPMFPFHVWLPEAHVEAPTVGSVLLAGVLLKLGTYGMLRFLIPLFPQANNYFTPFVFLLSIIAIIYISLTALRQIDLKKIIAYASIAHMNYVVLGMFSLNLTSYVGSIFLMISHGLVSSALFFSIGILYDRYKTRILKYYGGLVVFMPLFSFFFLIFTLANMSFPGTSNFIGEFLVLVSLINDNFFICFLSTFCIIFGAVYSIWLYNRIIFGDISFYFSIYSDICKREFVLLFLLLCSIIFFGMVPNTLLCELEFIGFFFLEYRILI